MKFVWETTCSSLKKSGKLKDHYFWEGAASILKYHQVYHQVQDLLLFKSNHCFKNFQGFIPHFDPPLVSKQIPPTPANQPTAPIMINPPVGIKKRKLHGRHVPHALQTWDCFHGQRRLGSEVAEVRTFFWHAGRSGYKKAEELENLEKWSKTIRFDEIDLIYLI